MSDELSWQARPKHTLQRTLLVILSVGIVLTLMLVLLPALPAVLLSIFYAFYVLLPYLIPVRYHLNPVGVRWGQRIGSQFRAWDSFKVYRLQPEGIELSAFSRHDGPVPMLNTYRAVFLPYGNLPPTELEAAVAQHLSHDV